MEQLGIIQRSDSPWASPLHVVPKAPEPGRQSSLKNSKTANVKPKRDKNKFCNIFYMHSF